MRLLFLAAVAHLRTRTFFFLVVLVHLRKQNKRKDKKAKKEDKEKNEKKQNEWKKEGAEKKDKADNWKVPDPNLSLLPGIDIRVVNP